MSRCDPQNSEKRPFRRGSSPAGDDGSNQETGRGRPNRTGRGSSGPRPDEQSGEQQPRRGSG